MKSSYLAMYASAFTLALGVSVSAWGEPASDTAATASAEPSDDALQEIVVTAERRTENLQTTPIAATVLGSDDLTKKGVLQMQDLQTAAPSLTIAATGLVSYVNIRGIGLNSNQPSVVPGVASYRDGLWEPPISSSDTFYDIGSVEILRGPQGTFVGSNSTGGAIFINSANPEFDDVHGFARLQGGNYADLGFQGAINLPINDTWAARIATDVEQRNSFYRDVTSQYTPSPATFDHPGSLDEKNLRGSLLGKPTDDLTILMKIESDSQDTGGIAWRPTPGTQYAPYAAPGPFDLDYDTRPSYEQASVRASLKIDWNIDGSGVILRSITGDQFMRVDLYSDIDATSSTLPAGPPSRTTAQAVIERPLTQEFNLISPDTGPFQWVGGVFLLHDVRYVALDIETQGIPTNQNILVNEQLLLQSEAAFGQVSYQLLAPLQLQAGVRYTRDKSWVPNGGNVALQDVIPGLPLLNLDQSGVQNDSVVTGKVALNWTLNDSNFLYAFVAKGAKSGGFSAPPVVDFAPEVVWDYEAGWKSNFFQNHLTTSLGVFYNNYKDLQVYAFIPSSSVSGSAVTNIGNSTIKGAEFELHASFDGLNVDFGGAYVNSKLGSINLVNSGALPPGENLPGCGIAGAPAPPNCFNYSADTVSYDGSQNPYSPEWTFNAGIQYTVSIGDRSALTPRINYSYLGPQWTTIQEAPQTDRLSPQGLWSGSLTFDRKPWQVQLYGLNIANKVYVIGQQASGANPDNNLLGNPRQFGVRVSRTF